VQVQKRFKPRFMPGKEFKRVLDSAEFEKLP